MNKNLTELTDEQLEQASGGGDDQVQTLMRCDFCQSEYPWLGDYMNDAWYICPSCQHRTFHGIRYY